MNDNLSTRSVWVFVAGLYRYSLFVLSLSLTTIAGVSADDTEIFFNGVPTAPPNVLFILDTSGSMDFAGSSGATRMDELKEAMTELLRDENTKNVNVGVMSFASNDRAYSATRVRLQVEPVETNRAAVIGTVQGLQSDGGTPTLRALEFARRYFGNTLRSQPWNRFSRILPSPIEHECQENHVVLLTDGSPSPDRAARSFVENNVLRAQCLRQDVAGQNPPFNQNNGTCGAELAKHMKTKDALRSIPGVNTITTHTIGFNFDQPWLATLSSADKGGGGTHSNVESIDDLKEALNGIFDSIGTASFAAPTVSTDSFNESRHRDELYYAQFEPSNSVRWAGNIKKYRIVDGEIVDRDNQPIGEAAAPAASSRSLWSDVADGASVTDGGFAKNLPDFADRYWYTDFRVTSNAVGRLKPVRVTTNTKDYLTTGVLGADSNQERDDLVSWALGSDIENDASNNHYYVSDALHGTPQLLSYRATRNTTPQERTEVLYSATNLGVLHAIDADSGEELWSYTPEEHLPRIKEYVENEVGGPKVYGLDGEIMIHSTRKAVTDYDYEVDKAHLYLTERRGGNRIYALDVSNGFNKTDPFDVMWKITGGTAEFPDLAQTWSKPKHIKVKYGCPGDCQARELLLFGGGYNPLYDDVNFDYATFSSLADVPANGHGNAVYLVDPETGELVWSAGNGAHHSLDLPMRHSVPSTPVPVDTNLDGYVDLLFFVDLGGDVWRVDLSKGDSQNRALHLSGGQIAALSPVGQSLRFFNPLGVSLSGLNASTSNFHLVTGSGMRNSPLHDEPHNNRLYSITDRWIQQVPYRVDPSTDEKKVDYRYVTSTDGTPDIIRADDSVLRNVDNDDSDTSVTYGFYKAFPQGQKVLVPTSTRKGRILSSVYVPPEITDGCGGGIGVTNLHILALPTGENAIPAGLGGNYYTVGEGILGSGVLVDNGHLDAPYLLFDKQPLALKDVLTGTPDVYRKFQRTGWVEHDEY